MNDNYNYEILNSPDLYLVIVLALILIFALFSIAKDNADERS
tara:strand:- start:534 stop:659 length:126 start_codon:yes stop_codon:yes gene_type:complete